jgi:hypothetical protein
LDRRIDRITIFLNKITDPAGPGLASLVHWRVGTGDTQVGAPHSFLFKEER